MNSFLGFPPPSKRVHNILSNKRMDLDLPLISSSTRLFSQLHAGLAAVSTLAISEFWEVWLHTSRRWLVTIVLQVPAKCGGDCWSLCNRRGLLRSTEGRVHSRSFPRRRVVQTWRFDCVLWFPSSNSSDLTINERQEVIFVSAICLLTSSSGHVTTFKPERLRYVRYPQTPSYGCLVCTSIT